MTEEKSPGFGLIENMIEKLKANPKASVSIAGLVTLVGLYGGLTTIGDDRYLLAAEGMQTQQMIQQHIEYDYEDQIFVLSIKKTNGTATAVDLAILDRLEKRLKALRNPVKKD